MLPFSLRHTPAAIFAAAFFATLSLLRHDAASAIAAALRPCYIFRYSAIFAIDAITRLICRAMPLLLITAILMR